MDKVAANIADLKKAIGTSAREYGRAADSVTLVAVSKMQQDERIEAALKAGQRVFGENRVQEAEERWAGRRRSYPDLILHLIGPLQTNKVADAVALFDVIETLDRPRLADALAAEMKKQGRALPCFIQVNTGAEAQKAGVLPEDLPDLLRHARKAGLDVTGLMCIPPVDQPPGLHFVLLQQLARAHGLRNLSMGMSADFEKGIAAGATHVRIGTALFGER